jgi:head-tail adaptor
MDRANIEAGELRQRIIIQAKSVASAADTRGHPVRTWTDSIVDVSCKIETPSGRKLELARQLVPTASHTVTMRFRVIDEENYRLALFGLATTALSAGINSSVTAISVATAIAIPVGAVILIGTEKMLVTAVSGTTLAVTRGYESTTAATQASGATVRKRRLFNIGHVEDVEELHVRMILTCTEMKGSAA